MFGMFEDVSVFARHRTNCEEMLDFQSVCICVIFIRLKPSTSPSIESENNNQIAFLKKERERVADVVISERWMKPDLGVLSLWL